MQEIQPQGTGGQTWKNIKNDWNCGFWKRDSLSVFQSSFLFFVTIDMILGGHICFSQSCDLILTSSYFSNAEVHNRVANHWLKNELANRDTAPLSLIWSAMNSLLFSFEKWSVLVKKNYTHRDAMEASNDSCSCSVAFICSSTCLALKTTDGKRQYDDKRRDTHRWFTAVQKKKWWVQ